MGRNRCCCRRPGCAGCPDAVPPAGLLLTINGIVGTQASPTETDIGAYPQCCCPSTLSFLLVRDVDVLGGCQWAANPTYPLGPCWRIFDGEYEPGSESPHTPATTLQITAISSIGVDTFQHINVALVIPIGGYCVGRTVSIYYDFIVTGNCCDLAATGVAPYSTEECPPESCEWSGTTADLTAVCGELPGEPVNDPPEDCPAVTDPFEPDTDPEDELDCHLCDDGLPSTITATMGTGGEGNLPPSNDSCTDCADYADLAFEMEGAACSYYSTGELPCDYTAVLELVSNGVGGVTATLDLVSNVSPYTAQRFQAFGLPDPATCDGLTLFWTTEVGTEGQCIFTTDNFVTITA